MRTAFLESSRTLGKACVGAQHLHHISIIFICCAADAQIMYVPATPVVAIVVQQPLYHGLGLEEHLLQLGRIWTMWFTKAASLGCQMLQHALFTEIQLCCKPWGATVIFSPTFA